MNNFGASAILKMKTTLTDDIPGIASRDALLIRYKDDAVPDSGELNGAARS